MTVKGDAGAQNDLGRCYYDGIGVEKDDLEAVKWYRKAATKLGRPPKLTSETAASSSWKQD